MGSAYDPNVPEYTDEGEYLCKLCLATMNSDQMWASHIAGKRHAKNVQKYPNGLPRFPEDEDSHDRSAKHDRYKNDGDYDDDYLFSEYGDYYSAKDYNETKPMDYVPEVRPNVVIDYGHNKKIDDLLLPTSNKSEVTPKKEKAINIDAIIENIKKSELKKNTPEKDDFFEKINQRQLAKELAQELNKKRFPKNETKSNDIHKKSGKEESSDSDEDRKLTDKKFNKRKSSDKQDSPDIFDFFHKYNDAKLFKGSKIENCKDSSSSTNSAVKFNNLDPNTLTTDALDDILSSYLKPKAGSAPKNAASSLEKAPPGMQIIPEKIPSVDSQVLDSQVFAEKLHTLPTKTFLNLMYEKLQNVELKDSEDKKLLLKIISYAQELLCKNLPAHAQARLKAKLSVRDSKTTEVNIQNTTGSQNFCVAAPSAHKPINEVTTNYTLPCTSQITNTAYPTVPPISQISSNVPNLAISSQAGNVQYNYETQRIPGRFPVPGAPLHNPVGFPVPGAPLHKPVGFPNLLQNNQALPYLQMMYSMHQNRQDVPFTASTPSASISSVNSIPTVNSVPRVNSMPVVKSVPVVKTVPVVKSVPAVKSVPSVNSVPNTSNTLPPQNRNRQATSVSQPNPPSSLQATLNHLKMLAEKYKSRKESRDKSEIEAKRPRTEYKGFKYSK